MQCTNCLSALCAVQVQRPFTSTETEDPLGSTDTAGDSSSDYVEEVYIAGDSCSDYVDEVSRGGESTG